MSGPLVAEGGNENITLAMPEHSSSSKPLPLVGRSVELEDMYTLLREVEEGESEYSSVLLRGTSGVGKTRLAEALIRNAGKRGWTVTRGRAYPVESGVADGVLRDTLHPLLSELSEDRLTVLTRGGLPQLAPLLPWMESPRSDVGAPASSSEARARTHWTLAELLRGLAVDTPLLLYVEDLEWADGSSLEAIHFLARQLQGQRVLLLGCVADDRAWGNAPLEEALASLERSGILHTVELGPLTGAEVAELLEKQFEASPELVGGFARRLWERTGGNPFFVEETLEFLVAEGHLRPTDEGWVGWETASFDAPAPTIEESILRRAKRLGSEARRALETAAVLGTRTDADLLRRASELDDSRFLDVVEELCAGGFLVQDEPVPGEVELRFQHSLVRDAVEQGMSSLSRRDHHLRVLDLLRAKDGRRRDATELAAHLLQLPSSQLTSDDRQVLGAAGRSALKRGADLEAVRYLRAALDGNGKRGAAEAAAPDAAPALLTELARGLRRLGKWDEAVACQERVIRILTERGGGAATLIEAQRQLSLTRLAEGRPDLALQRPGYGQGDAARERGRETSKERTDTTGREERASDVQAARVGLKLVRAAAHHQLGQVDEGRREAREALEIAEALGDPGLLARVHRVLTLSFLWTGDADSAREHGHGALEAAGRSGDLELAGRVHWALAVVGGFTAQTRELERHLDACRDAAETLRSPSLLLAWLDVAIQRAEARGEWAEGVALGEQAIDLALALDRRSILPRLKVWTGLLHLGRGRPGRALELIDEAWVGAGADRRTGRELATDVHSLIPAHLGRARYHLATGGYEEAVRYARDGLAIADEAGYAPWALHRLLPTLAEAYLWLGDLDGARRVGSRIRTEAAELGHPLGIAWADACDALVVWLSGDAERGAEMMVRAVKALEDIPMIPDAARLRRQLSGRLAEAGEPDRARQELERAYESFVRLGMEQELEKARGQFRELDARPPSRSLYEGVDGLTAREIEIIQHVARRRSNKAIGKALGISPRTVSTHLSNIYRKVDVSGRGELTDRARTEGWVEDRAPS